MAVAASPSSASLEPTKITTRIARPSITTVQDQRRPSAYSDEDVTPARAIRRQRGLMYSLSAIANDGRCERAGVERGDTIEVTIGGVRTLCNTVAGASR
jgi:hypothetical protein